MLDWSKRSWGVGLNWSQKTSNSQLSPAPSKPNTCLNLSTLFLEDCHSKTLRSRRLGNFWRLWMLNKLLTTDSPTTAIISWLLKLIVNPQYSWHLPLSTHSKRWKPLSKKLNQSMQMLSTLKFKWLKYISWIKSWAIYMNSPNPKDPSKSTGAWRMRETLWQSTFNRMTSWDLKVWYSWTQTSYVF